MNHQPNTPASLNEAVATINGEPATAHSLLAALVDIHDDQKNAPEDRCYVESAWGDCMRIARAFLASAITPEPSLKERADALMAAGHAFWQACRRDAGGGAVRWLKATDGTTIIFTRGEYAGTLLSAIGTDYQAPEIVFEQPVGDDDMGGIVASIAAPGAAIDAREQEVAICGVLAGEPAVLGERCKDGGKCHHACTSVCFRRDGNYCGPLTGSRLNHDWSEPASRQEAPTASQALSPATVAQPVANRDALMKLSQFAHTAAHMSERECRNNLLSIADQLIALASRKQEKAHD